MTTNARRTRICLSCVGGVYSYDSIQSLRAEPEFPVWILGVDTDPEAHGRLAVNHFEVVPRPENDPTQFVERLLSLCIQHKIEALILTSEGESLAVAARREDFISQGVSVSVSDSSVVERMTDKFAMLEHLATVGTDVGPFFKVDDENDLISAASSLQYPAQKFVLKPRRGAGSRGILIFDSNASEYRSLLEDRFCGIANFDQMRLQISVKGQSLENMLAVPYYGDIAYDVDCVSKNGTVVAVVPRLREYQNPLSPFVEGCRIDLNRSVIDLVSQVTEHFGVHGACDYDVAIDGNGLPRLMDASCRPSGSCGATSLAGVNVLLQLVRVMLNTPLAPYEATNGVRFRPFRRLSPLPFHTD